MIRAIAEPGARGSRRGIGAVGDSSTLTEAFDDVDVIGAVSFKAMADRVRLDGEAT